VTQEDARATYTGSNLFWTPSVTSNTATVTLTATVRDITAVLNDSQFDQYGGDIRNAKVTFVNRTGTTSTALANCTGLTPALVSSGDPMTGTVSCTTPLTFSGQAGGDEFTIGIKVDGYYIDDQAEENTVINVAQPLASSFITGGGHLINSDYAAGQYAPDSGRKTNLGFNVKYNKSGTNLQGNVNVIFRKGTKTYQMKSNSLTSLGVQYCKSTSATADVTGCQSGPTSPCTTNAAATCPITATFQGKANMNDVSNPNSTVSLGGNLSLQMSLTDRGEPGASDTVGIALYNGSTLLFSSRWSGKTIEQALAGGNLVAH